MNTVDLSGGGALSGGGSEQGNINLAPAATNPFPATDAHPSYSGTAEERAEPMLDTGYIPSSVTRAATFAGRGIQSAGIEIHAYVQEFPDHLKIFSFIVGLAVFITHIWRLVVFMYDANFNFISDFWQAIFGLGICIIESKDEWTPQLRGMQQSVFKSFAFLVNFKGRALFYIYLGLMTMGEALEPDEKNKKGLTFEARAILWTLTCSLYLMGFAGFALSPPPGSTADTHQELGGSPA